LWTVYLCICRCIHEDKNHPDFSNRRKGYVAPKRPYSFDALLQDILHFAAEILVDGGRLALWMPTANDADVELLIPQSTYLKLLSVCVQRFNKWSRRLLVYARLPEVVTGPVVQRNGNTVDYRGTADSLNDFRRRVSFESIINLVLTLILPSTLKASNLTKPTVPKGNLDIAPVLGAVSSCNPHTSDYITQTINA
jgi:hypothetical protein